MAMKISARITSSASECTAKAAIRSRTVGRLLSKATSMAYVRTHKHQPTTMKPSIPVKGASCVHSTAVAASADAPDPANARTSSRRTPAIWRRGCGGREVARDGTVVRDVAAWTEGDPADVSAGLGAERNGSSITDMCSRLADRARPGPGHDHGGDQVDDKSQ